MVVGLAREGRAVATFLAQQGASVSVTDAQTSDRLSKQIEALQHLDIRFYLGEHPYALLDPAQADLVVVSPGVPLTIPFLQQASLNKRLLSTESRLFCQLCPAPIIGVSGSSGKTTTSTLIAKMLQVAGFTTHIGGNIGQPLITHLGQIQAQDWVVMELSSFQLEYFHPTLNQKAKILPHLQGLAQGWSPKIGLLLNITPNHLDRHKTMAAYTWAKQALLNYMGPEQVAILGWDNPITQKMGQNTSGLVKYFSLNGSIEVGACLSKGQICLFNNGYSEPICAISDIKLRGEHNLYNILAACLAAYTAGASIEAMAEVATTFTGVAHRLEVVAHQEGVTYINDSIATSPERLMAALKAFNNPIILLAGGKDKDLPWADAAKLILKKVKHLLLFGQAEGLILDAVKQAQSATDSLQIDVCHTLEAAVIQAQTLAQSGDIVLLSPGGTSYDAYSDFAARGEHFKRLVQKKSGLT